MVFHRVRPSNIGDKKLIHHLYFKNMNDYVNLPTLDAVAPGSDAFCLDTSQMFVLSSKDVWVEIELSRGDGSGGNGAGSAQSDWAENDPQADSHIQNRPFQTVVPPVAVVFSKDNILFDDWGDSQGWETKLDDEFLVEGVEYKVVLDGVLYTTTAFRQVSPSGATVMDTHIGFWWHGGEWPQEECPFCILRFEEDGAYGITIQLRQSPQYTHSISISAAIPSTKQLDPKYIPIGEGLVVKDGVLESRPMVTLYTSGGQFTGTWWLPEHTNDPMAALKIYQVTEQSSGKLYSEGETGVLWAGEHQAANGIVDISAIGTGYDNQALFVPMACYIDLANRMLHYQPLYPFPDTFFLRSLRTTIRYTKDE